MRALAVRLGVDGHVLDGKRQGSRSVLANFLSAFKQLPRDDVAVTVYCDDPARHAADPVLAGARFAPLAARGRTRRLIFGGLGPAGSNDVELYNYALPLLQRARSLLMIHDVLPFTHGHLFPRRFRIPFGLLVRRSVRRADRIITVSETGRRALIALAPKVASRVDVALNGPSFSEDVLLAPAPPRAGRPYVLAVGRIERRKNVGLLLDAFLAAGLEEIDLVIVGRLDEGFTLDFPADPRIHHETDVDDDQLVELYRGAALFVYPSSAEGFGIPLLDALAFGLPTISSDRTSMPEVGGDLPHYFNPDAHDAGATLATLIRSHFGDDPIPAPSLAARRALLERFNWRRFADTVLDAAAQAAR